MGTVAIDATCYGPDCSRSVEAKGLCHTHYEQLRRTGELTRIFARRRPNGSAFWRDDQGNKQCTRCRAALPKTEFSRNRTMADGLQPWCKTCQRDGYARRRVQAANQKLIRKFGISIEQRNALLAAQGGVCGVCQSPDSGSRDWAVDHDHRCCPARSETCGQCIRGILCGRCNMTLGAVSDDPALLRNMITYLEQNGKA